MVIVGSIGVYGIGATNKAFKTVYEDRMVALQELNDLRRLLLRDRLAIAYAVIADRPETSNATVEELATNSRDVKKL